MEAAEDAPLLKNVFYYAPPGHHMAIKDGTFHLIERIHEGNNYSIDLFLESLAINEIKKHSTAIILSGSGTDGVRGTAAIKKAGGLAIVQMLSSYEFPDLPNKVIKNVSVDYTLLPEDMPSIIQGYVNRYLVDKSV